MSFEYWSVLPITSVGDDSWRGTCCTLITGFGRGALGNSFSFIGSKNKHGDSFNETGLA